MPAGPNQSNSGEPASAQALAGVLQILRTVSGMKPEQLEVRSSFLELGFDSLLLVQVVQSLESAFGVKVSIIQLLEETTTAESLAAYLAKEVPAERFLAVDVSAPTASSSSRSTDSNATVSLSTPPRQGPSSNPSPAGAAMERLVAQQLEIMRQQIEALRLLGAEVPSTGSNGSPAACAIPKKQPSEPVSANSAAKPVVAETAPYIPPFQPLQVEAKGGVTAAQKEYLDRFVASFVRRTAESKRVTQQHRAVLADARCTTGFKLLWKEMVYPIVAASTRGSTMVDLDGNSYVDITMGFGVHLFGHSPPFIMDALRAQMERSISLGPQTALAGEVAALLATMSGMDRVVFCNSGTEALMGVVRAARTVTRRRRLVMFSGSYHGCADATLSRPGPAGEPPRGMPIAPGVDPQAVEETIVLEYGTEASLRIIESMAGELAAVLVEPVQSRQPWIQPTEFLRQLREITTRSKVVLVFDETITGFRGHGNGAQDFFGVRADVVMYGKHLGGGLPIGVLCGRREVMDMFDGGDWRFGDTSYPVQEKTLFTGTYFKHPLTLAASLAVLRHLRDQPAEVEALNRRTASMVESLNRICEAKNAPFRLNHFASLFKLRWLSEPPLKNLFFYELVSRGVYYPLETNNCFLSTAHTDADVERIVAAFSESLDAMLANGFFFETQPRVAQGEVRSGTSVQIPTPPPLSAPRSIESRPSLVSAPAQPVGFSLYFFGDYPAEYASDKYRLLLDAVQYADREGFEAVWLPERHFHSFGGFSPNPAVLAAALAGMTKRLHLRAGSVVLPLHHPLRAAEDWALADNLSGGRVGISFATGWHPNDFVFAPENYEARHKVTEDRIAQVRSLWRGESVEVVGGAGNRFPVRLHPQPCQRELPFWISGVSPQAFEAAGRMGAGILTNLQIITLEELAERVKLYRKARAAAGFDPSTGKVTVLLHAYLGDSVDGARTEAREPFLRYVRSSMEISSLKITSEGGKADMRQMSEQEMQYLAGSGYDRYLRQNRVLIGTVDSCAEVVAQLVAAGATEIGCLIDFGVSAPSALSSLKKINELQQRFRGTSVVQEDRATAASGNQSASGGPFPLTDGQRALFTISQLSQEAHRTYQEAVGIRLRGRLDLSALRGAVQRVVDRHEALRTTFTPEGDAQVVHDSLQIEVPCTDLSGLSGESQEQRLKAVIRSVEQELMDLQQGPLISVRVFKLAETDHVLMVTLHHLVADGHSYGMLFRELREFYSAAVRGEQVSMEPPSQYRDYVAWLGQKASSLEAERCRTYWLGELSGELPVLELPTDRPRPSQRRYRGERLKTILPSSLVRGLRKLGARQGSTLMSVLLAGYELWLHRLSGQNDVIVALPAMGEALAPSNDIFGYRINVLPIRSQLTESIGFSDYVKQVRNRVLRAMEHQHLFVGSLVGQLGLKRDPSRSLLFSTLFNLDRATPMPDWEGVSLEEFPLVSRNPSDTARFDLSVNLLERTNGDVLVELDFNTDLFDRSTLERWLESWETLLESAVKAPDCGVWDLPMVPASQREVMSRSWNATSRTWSGSTLLHELFEEQVARTPEAVAVVCEGVKLTYRELDVQANRLAHRLAREGVEKDRLVAVCCERSPAMVIAILAVLKAGGAYVPVDPEYPAARIAFMLQDSSAAVVLAHQPTRDRLASFGSKLLLVEEHVGTSDLARDSKPSIALDPDALAYVIYTSGSTGQPKGVMIPHRGIVNHMRWMQRVYPLGSEDAVFQKTPFSFDASVWEFYAPLLAGGRLVMARPAGHRDPGYLVETIQSAEITVLQLVPSLLRLLLDEPDFPRCKKLKRLFCGGESLTPELVKRCYELLPQITVHNLYGPTEATIDATVWDCEAQTERSMVPIGRPVDNTFCYIVDDRLQPVPVGVLGELLIGGAGLARGYWNRSELTRDRFIRDPWSSDPAARLYRTGDRCRYRADGVIEFFGRADQQVKLHGFRIELEEIEKVLQEHAAVKQAAVLLRRSPATDRAVLVAYVVLGPGQDPAIAEDALRQHLRGRLADYMMPSRFVLLPTLPRTPNGKLDRAALPDPQPLPNPPPSPSRPPAGRLETLLLEVWSSVLGRSGTGVDENIFDLGGDSILIARISVEAKRRGVSVPPKLIYTHQTVAALAEALASEERDMQARQAHLREKVASLSPEQVRAMLAAKRRQN